ncbi:pyruvate kinase [Macrococcus equipercicus]|uniref:Pyruvate kinase n=1 Tax=Macrococcus equipercicus TaxID=69967 RepID=A0ABQ6R9E4_9STAP|nr:pyruvate kinase [Macrococcus equipercicus]KAA1039902.1 pyruvate kinase [Macrococcus equipercicus]
MRKTKIVCTIGPASEAPEMLEQLIEAGMNVARLNFSHGSHEEHAARIANIRQAAHKLNKTVAILLDTKGPEIRTHNMENGRIELTKGSTVAVNMSEVTGTPEEFSVTYSQLIDDVHVGSTILLDDGLIELNVKAINHDEGKIICDVINAGELKNKKGVNVPGVKVNLPGITDKDAEDIKFGIEQKVDFIAASFVRRASDVLEIRKILEERQCDFIHIIPKIENEEGIENIDQILVVSDGLMVARGDMGVEIPAEKVPLVQKDLIRKCNALGKPVITATQMLDSMQRNPRCTRAEASDVANAIYDGSDAVMLSGETAAGLYPVESVRTMHNIAYAAEEAQDYKKLLSDRTKMTETTMVNAIGVSVAHTALNLNVQTIVAATESGHTATTISKYRPHAHIVAVTPYEETARHMALVWGVLPLVKEGRKTTDQLLNGAAEAAIETGTVDNGDLIIITAGVPTGEAGTTNLMQIQLVGDELATGQGIGRDSAVGRVVAVKEADELEGKDLSSAIIVTQSTDADMVPYIEQALAIVTEEGGLTSHAAVVGLTLGKPTIVGVDNIFSRLDNDTLVTVDAAHNKVYAGHAKV